MIQSFACADTERLFQGTRVPRFVNIATAAERKLQQLDCAQTLKFLRSPPGNRLEPLTGDRAGQFSIRINAQWRICFFWTAKGPEQVAIVDCH